MVNFIRLEPESERIPAMLTREVPGFAESPECGRLHETERQVTGLACAALARYWLRLQGQEQAGTSTPDAAEALAAIYRIVETLASSDDPEARNLVTTEILENLDSDPRLLAVIKPRLGEHSRALYDRWLA